MRDDPSRVRRPLLPLDFELGGTSAESHPYFLLDCFSSRPLAGNQLAVFVAGGGLSTELMQAIAKEMNLSESVFLLPPEAGGTLRARIFTPARELPFAGHPVLGTAVLAGMALGLDAVALETGAGMVEVDLEREGGPGLFRGDRGERSEVAGAGGSAGSEDPGGSGVSEDGPEAGPRGVFAWMRQPIPSWEPYERSEELLRALGVERSALPVEVYRNGPRHVYVALEDEAAVAAVAPDLAALGRHADLGVNCFAGPVSESPGPPGPSDESPGSAELGVYWKTRMFAPSLGVAEDPATGSAAGPLAVHLARHGRIAFGEEIEIRQGDELGRPSRLYARVEGGRVEGGRVEGTRGEGASERIDRVEVGGAAVVVGRGELVLPR
ncbi:MAG: PhzF family phenazine biosynthesis protein [Thermoanaerobaculia bacterium]|nr:PhzF family phenazine biosynthesis protein [Thermoanaerobaculia bacterium]